MSRIELGWNGKARCSMPVLSQITRSPILQVWRSAVIFALSAIPRMVHLEESLGTVTGHAEALTIINNFLDRIEPATQPASRRRPKHGGSSP